ncbi:SRPBCC domain-containing protein [Streptomyces sparsus]
MDAETANAAVELPTDQQASFTLFTSGLSRWWPAEFSWSGAENLTGMGMDERLDGALYEIGEHGLRWDWGRVLAWDPPNGLVFSWQIGPDRVPVPRADQATEVSVTFTAQGAGTLVEVRHSGWERHGELGPGYLENFRHAWPMALDALHRAATDAV